MQNRTQGSIGLDLDVSGANCMRVHSHVCMRADVRPGMLGVSSQLSLLSPTARRSPPRHFLS